MIGGFFVRSIWKRISNAYDRILLFFYRKRAGFLISAEILALLFLGGCLILKAYPHSPAASCLLSLLSQERIGTAGADSQQNHLIKWVDFNVPEEAMTKAFRLDVATCQQQIHLNWIELLAFLGARYGGDFSNYQEADMDELAERLQNGISMEQLSADVKQYPYYLEAYTAVLGGLVGYYEIEIPVSEAPSFALSDARIQEDHPSSSASPSSSQDPEKVWVTKYGLKGFHPIAKGFAYTDYDDFGVSRSYGYKRKHLGHDMMGQTGTPVMAAESGYVETMGWNQYGGWRIGIRSFDKKRYYYYAHLRKDYPYQSCLSEGSIVTAGEVIGYMGRTGYSSAENTNNIDKTHLHFGLQLIFDESQKEGNGEIWINCYELMKFLRINQSEAARQNGTKEWKRIYEMKDPAAEEAKKSTLPEPENSKQQQSGHKACPAAFSVPVSLEYRNVPACSTESRGLSSFL